MAEIRPFRAWRYDAQRSVLASVVTQPYDKITPEMQERYYWTSPYNLVRVILGKPAPEDDAANNVYSRAAGFFQDWRNSGVMKQDAEPSLYAYSQRFAAPGEADRELERRGLIALGRLHDYSEQIVFPHEQTHSRPKADRLDLLRATRAHFGQLFMLYDDPQHRVDALLPWSDSPLAEISDDYGVVNRLWRISDAALIESVVSVFKNHKLIIADGHHRYETALNYRNEQRAPQPSNGPQVWDFVMMTFINLNSPGLVILPTHRVVSGLPSFDPARFLSRAAEFFQVEAAGRSPAPATRSIIAVTQVGDYRLQGVPEKLRAVLAGVSKRQSGLDVVVLHKILLERVLGISQEAIREQKYISYVRDPAEATATVRRHEADVAFLINPVGIYEMRDVALAGEFMPQKSTDFYPKLLSGLTIYALD